MSRPEFFIIEAAEHLERLALLAGASAPDPEALLRFSRALRGSAAMAGPPGYAIVAGAFEEVARRYGSGALDWGPEVARTVGSALEQCRELLRRVPSWSAPEVDWCRQVAVMLLQLEPEGDIVPIESLAPEPETPVVSIEELAPEGEIVPIESLLYDVPVALSAPRPDARLTPFERSFSTYFRLLHGGAEGEAQPVPIERLLYRGRRALERADLVRQELVAGRRSRARADQIESLLHELLDLVPLALERD